MSANDKRIWYFSLLGFLFFSLLSYVIPTPQPVSPDTDKDIPSPHVVSLGNQEQIQVSPGPWKNVQYILFNSSRCDTVTGKNSMNVAGLPGNNHQLLREISSHKFMPAAGKVPQALVVGMRYINKKGTQASPWAYYTGIKTQHAFNVVSVMCNPNDVFGFDKGIYVTGATQLYENTTTSFNSAWWLRPGNWSNKGKEWERPVYFQLLSSKGETIYESGAGMRINGNATRGFAQKSLRLTAAKKYGSKNFGFSFFGKKNADNYKALVLRNGGNDWGRTMFADRFIQSCLPAGIDHQEHMPVVVYINGIYWGIYSMCEKMDEEYLSRKYKVKTKKITLLEGETLDTGDEKERDRFSEMVKKCREQDFSTEENYNEFCDKVDIENFALFMAIQLYVVNTDLHNQNVYTYKLDDARWRWIVRDLDCSYSYSGDGAVNADMFSKYMNTNGALGYMFKACMQNKGFKTLLRNQLEELLSTSFDQTKQLEKLAEYEKVYAPEIPLQANRWRKPGNETYWKNCVTGFRRFIEKRETVIRQQINKYL